MKIFKTNLLKKLGLVVTAGVIFAGTGFSRENEKIKELVDSKYYETLTQKGIVSNYRDDGSKGFLLLPESVYSEKINESMINKEPKNYPYTFEGSRASHH